MIKMKEIKKTEIKRGKKKGYTDISSALISLIIYCDCLTHKDSQERHRPLLPYFTDEEDKAWRGLRDQHHSLESRGQGVPENTE